MESRESRLAQRREASLLAGEPTVRRVVGAPRLTPVGNDSEPRPETGRRMEEAARV
jgi:hypothetical protein